MKYENYQCIRCGYNSPQRTDMIRHFKRKKTCPTLVNNIELTDDIKQHIVDNRKYILPAQHVTSVHTHQTIYNNNQKILNNFIVNMDPIEKLIKLTGHQKIDIVPFSEKVELSFQQKNNDDVLLSKEEYVECVHVASTLSSDFAEGNLSNFNLLYDKATKRIKIYEDGKWNDLYLQKGLMSVISNIQEHFLDNYECKLIRKIESSTNLRYKQKCKEALSTLYEFLATFNMPPYVASKADNEILYEYEHALYGKGEDKYDMNDRFYPMYQNVLSNMKSCKKTQTIKDVVDVLKCNTHDNICTLNKIIKDLLKMDASFQLSIE